MRILLVDDEPLILDTIAPFLTRCGHVVETNVNSTDATAAIGNRDGEFDLLITDVCMPGRDGIHLLRMVRQRYPDIDIVLMTGQSQVADLRQAVEEGATGFLRKPLKLNELRLLIDQVASSRSDRTKIHRLATNLDEEKNLRANMTRERMFARRLHQRIFPSDFSWLRQTEVAIRHLPQAGLGGDYMDVRPYGSGKALVFVADVSGHGTPAAFGGIALKTWFSSLETGLSPVDVLARADAMMRDLFPEDYYATAFCASYDEATRDLAYASAGHPEPLVLSARGGQRVLAASGAALGMLKDPKRDLLTTVLAVDEVLLVYTDGLSNDLAAVTAQIDKPFLGHLGKPHATLKDLLTGALDLATSAAPLHSFSDDISLLALRPRTADLPDRVVALAGKRVLHIEDEWGIRSAIGAALRRQGMITEECALAADALAKIMRFHPDLVILDLMLPDAPGQDLFREIRQHHPHLPVLVISGNEVDHSARTCFDLNPAGILTKPVNLRELERALLVALQFDPDHDLVAFDNLGNEWFDFVISSSTAALELLTRYLQALGRQPLPEEVLDDLVWCIREMAMNGIEWGNRFAPHLKVRVSTLIMTDRVMVKISDEGSGFDTHQLFEPFDPLHVSEERDRQGKRVGGFGLAMVQAKMSRVEFNLRGNVVLLVKDFSN
jgi:phosphoserine phosphatase RsbU/P